MTDAKTLLLSVLSAIPDGEKVAGLFAEDGVVELPFLISLHRKTKSSRFRLTMSANVKIRD